MKVTGAVQNLVQGVSTQNPKERIEGQVWTMTNFLADPVEGAVKRPGVKHLRSLVRPLPAEAGSEIHWRNLNIETGEYALGTYAGHILLRNLVTGDEVTVNQDPTTYPYFQDGVKATANIGEYTLLAGSAIAEVSTQQQQSLFPQAYRDNSLSTSVDVNRVVEFEIRQGAYAGVYAIRRNDGTVLATYTVPDGSVASHSTNAQPKYIANQLYTQLVAAIGGSVGSAVIKAVHQEGGNIAVFFTTESVDQSIGMFADDGAYNTRMLMTDRFVTDSVKLPALGIEGHVVEIGSSSSQQGNYYLRFEHTQGTGTLGLSSNTLRPGRWVETSKSYASTGYSSGGTLEESTLPSLMYFHDGRAYVGSGAYIAQQVQSETGFVIDFPLSWPSRTSGDDSSNPNPLFVGSAIRWMGIFQDRLVIISDSAVDMSATGDYLRFYRNSVIDDLATDPIHQVSTYDPTDTLVGAALLDKNLVVIGTKSHYTVSGRTALTPSTPLLKTATFESSPVVAPVSFGNLVYFSSASANTSDVLAIQPSDVTDSTYAYSVSAHVDGYIPGDLSTMQASTKIDILFTLSDAGELFPYRTLFNQGERMLSSWFKFTFPTDLTLRCISLSNTKVRMLFDRVDGDNYFTVVGELDLDRIGYTGAAGHRYLDFWQDVDAVTGALDPVYVQAVLGNSTGHVVDLDNNLLFTVLDGEEWPEYEAGTRYMVGVPYEAVFEPTMPLARDREGRVIGIGVMVVGQMQVMYTLASGFTVRVADKFRDHTFEYAVRQVGAPDSFTDSDYIRDGSYRFPVGSSDPGCRVSITSYDHFPLILSSIDWAGQYYKRGTSI